jgi:hypothetical protein
MTSTYSLMVLLMRAACCSSNSSSSSSSSGYSSSSDDQLAQLLPLLVLSCCRCSSSSKVCSAQLPLLTSECAVTGVQHSTQRAATNVTQLCFAKTQHDHSVSPVGETSNTTVFCLTSTLCLAYRRDR